MGTPRVRRTVWLTAEEDAALASRYGSAQEGVRVAVDALLGQGNGKES